MPPPNPSSSSYPPARTLRARLTRLLESASTEQRGEGEAWYPTARLFCEQVAAETGTPLVGVVGILSALSVAVEWELTKSQTRTFCQQLGPLNLRTGYSTYMGQLLKAGAIKQLHDPYPSHVLEILGPRAWKTGAFFLTILDPFDRRVPAVIDRRAVRALGVPEPRSKAQYMFLSSIYAHVSRRLGCYTSQGQAIAWVCTPTLRPLILERNPHGPIENGNSRVHPDPERGLPPRVGSIERLETPLDSVCPF